MLKNSSLKQGNAAAFWVVRVTWCCSLVLGLSACSSGYILRAAYEETKILLGRQSIDSVIDNPASHDNERSKLKLVNN